MRGGKNELSKLNIMLIAKTAPGYLLPSKTKSKEADANKYGDMHNEYFN